MSEQELWEAMFVAALHGSASPYDGWEIDRVQYLLNRATRIADDGMKVCLARRHGAALRENTAAHRGKAR